MAIHSVEMRTAKAFEPLLKPSRYKAAYGGRGSGKSHFFAEKLIDDHLSLMGLHSVCLREVQESLAQSAKKLIENKITGWGLDTAGLFKIQRECILCPGGGLMIFKGLSNETATSIKSLEGYGRAWIEEADTITSRSWRLLRPTMRIEGSEIWAGWNPRFPTDAIDQFFRGAEQPHNAIIVQANWRDNPWLPNTLKQERLDDLRMNPDHYDHVWEGGYLTAVEGAYYSKHLALARAEKRIGLVLRDPLMQCHAFFDLGGTGVNADACAIWIVQFVGKEPRVIDYYETVGQELSEHAQWLIDNNYKDVEIWLPHDGVNHGAVFRVTPELALKQMGFKVNIVPNAGKGAVSLRIEATRRIFHLCRFNESTCAGGLSALAWYHEKVDDVRKIGLGACHDWSSHGADAFGMMAIMYEQITKIRSASVERQRPKTRTRQENSGWMKS